MNVLAVLPLLAALAAGGAEVQVAKVESFPLLLPEGKAADSALPHSRARELKDVWVALKGVRLPDGSISVRCDGGVASPAHDFRTGLPR